MSDTSEIQGSASDQKREHGETSGDNASGSGTVRPGGTLLNMSISKLKRVDNGSSLIRAHPKDKNKSMDFWSSVFAGLDSNKLEEILSIARVDQDYDMNSFIRGIEYQGFDREFYIRHALTKMSVSVFCRFAIIGALRGSNFSKIVDTCDNMPQDLITAFGSMNFVKTPKKRTDLTILRNTASIPHWCAYWFTKAGVSPKIPTSRCPASIQFPGAASLPMSREVRLQHLQFCDEFSKLLPGGRFNLNIYVTAYKNPIAISVIPPEVLGVLGVGSQSESYQLSDDDMTLYANNKSLTTIR